MQRVRCIIGGSHVLPKFNAKLNAGCVGKLLPEIDNLLLAVELVLVGRGGDIKGKCAKCVGNCRLNNTKIYSGLNKNHFSTLQVIFFYELR